MVSDRGIRVSDLQPGDWAMIQCSCGHEMFVPPHAVRRLVKDPEGPITNLGGALRCHACNGTGSVVVSVRRPEAPAIPAEIMFGRM